MHDYVVFDFSITSFLARHRCNIVYFNPMSHGTKECPQFVNDPVVNKDPMGQLTNTRSSDGAPDRDVALKEVARIKIRHYRNLCLNRPDPIVFIPLTVDTTGRMYDEFIRLLFLHAHRETSALDNELPEESDKFLFLRSSCFANWKGVVGLIMSKSSDMWISIRLDLSPRSFIPTSCFIRSRRPTPLLAPSLVLFPPCSA